MPTPTRPPTRRLVAGVVAGLLWALLGAAAPLVVLPSAVAGPFGAHPVLSLDSWATPSRDRGSAAGPPTAGAARYRAPVAGPVRVVHPFVAPVTRYSAGHRGVDLATVSGQPVVAAAGGQVTFAGLLAGRGVVVIAHGDGLRTEYEPVAPNVARGDLVTAGQEIGTVAGAHSDCGVGGCLHWAASANGRYLDPMSLLRQLGVVRLIPSE